MAKKKLRIVGASATTLALVASLAPMGGVAFAADGTSNDNSPFWSAPTAAMEVDSNLMTTYGVRAGSAGADYVGISNVNFDPSGASKTDDGQQAVTGVNTWKGAALAIWGSSVNENPNPYLYNLLYSANQSDYQAGAVSATGATRATTWTNNPGTSSWGDSTGKQTGVEGNKEGGVTTAVGMEYTPDIIFGANKSGNWGNLSSGYATTNFYTYASADKSWNPQFANNDSTNLWTQIYTINQLASTANTVSALTGKTTRYDATAGALAYEQSLRGNLLYIASQIDANPSMKKTVAYLYAITDSGDAYFFIPEASGLTDNADTGDSDAQKALTEYAGNNGTIDLDYMDTLPFITNTFTGEEANQCSLYMTVEDIKKANPGVLVKADDTDALEGVTTVIYNTANKTLSASLADGTALNTLCSTQKNGSLSTSQVETWVSNHGGTNVDVIAGDDWNCSNKQDWTSTPTEDGWSPMLYCQRNYTTDKPARAVWAFSQVYSDLYQSEDDAYAYWVDTVYHIDGNENVAAVAKYMTHQSDEVVYTDDTIAAMQNRFQIGLDWWENTGSKSEEWSKFAYYNGSSRASYYDNNTASEEPTDLIGIMQPTQTWLDATATAKTDKDKLDLEIVAGALAVANTTISKDGSDVSPYMQWATQEAVDAYKAALEAADKVSDTDYVTQDVVDAAVAALDEATAAFDKAVQDGKMASAFQRLKGETAYGTMESIVTSTWDTADTVVLATFDGYWDALTASGYAGMTSSPILMTGKDSLDETTQNLITSLKAKNVVIIGGTAAVSADVEDALKAMNLNVSRIYGENAADTAVQVYKKATGWSKTAIVATSDGYWDALAASPLAYSQKDAIFLASDDSSATGNKLDEGTLAQLTTKNFDNVIIVGGTAAVSDDVDAQLAAAGFKTSQVQRLAGDNAVDTSNVIAKYCVDKAGMKASGFGVSTTSGYWDALTGGAMLGVSNSPLILVDKSDAKSGVGSFLMKYADQIDSAYVLGGTSAVPNSIVSAMDTFIAGDK